MIAARGIVLGYILCVHASAVQQQGEHLREATEEILMKLDGLRRRNGELSAQASALQRQIHDWLRQLHRRQQPERPQ